MLNKTVTKINQKRKLINSSAIKKMHEYMFLKRLNSLLRYPGMYLHYY